MKTDYYYTKRDEDRWTVSGRRAHLEIQRTWGPSGRVNRRDKDILQRVFLVKSRVSRISVSDQFDTDEHGFTRLKDALKYAVEKLAEYDDKVDPPKKRRR